MNLSEHFTFEELTASETAARLGIGNEPSESAFENLKRLADALETVRMVLRKPILITSGYRSKELNRMVGGSKNSAHMFGMAADFICPQFGTPLEVCRAVAKHGIDFDQIIHEYGRWCHFAIGDAGIAARKELLTATRNGYEKGLA